MKVRFLLAAVFVSMLLGGLLAAARPETASALSNCSASQLVPALRDVTVNQGVGSYARLVRGKETLVKFFLSNPTTCTVTSTQAINITGATLTINNTLQTFTGIGPFQTFAAAPAVSATLAVNSAADPIFAVPADDLVPALANPDTDTFSPTFTTTITYSRKAGTQTTTGLTVTYSNSAPVTFEHRTRALRVLFVPMGDGSSGVLASTQYTAADQTSTQNGVSALSRILPVEAGVNALGAASGGIRYTIDLSALLNLKAVAGAYDANQNFCGTAGNFDAIKGQLAQFMQSWNGNPVNVDKQVDRVVGVVGENVSDGADSPYGCADGMASLVSPEAWVRAIGDKPASGKTAASPSRTGSIMAMEVSHTWGTVQPTSSHHSANTVADATAPGRAYNVATRSYLATNRSVMKYSFVSSPPWDDTLTLLEPAHYAYDLCAFGGTTTADCAGLGTTAGTTFGVAAGPSFSVSGVVHANTNTAEIVQSGFASSLQQGADGNSFYRYVRRNATTGGVLTNLGFHVSFTDTLHGSGASENVGNEGDTPDGLFSFALPDDLPPAGSDPADVQLWKVASLSHTSPSVAGGDVLLYDKTQQASAPQLVSITSGAAAQPTKYTDTPSVDEVHPALSDDARWVAWEAPLIASVPGSEVIHVAPATSAANDVTLPVPTAGKRIVFESTRDTGDLEIYSMNADGTGQTRLTNHAGRDIMPAASPDGTKVAFVRTGDAGGDQIWLMSSSGGSEQQLTAEGSNAFPAWSPDGSRIAFMSNRAGEREIWVMNADGGNQHAVTTGGDDYYPTWSPSGDRIAFASTRGGGSAQIWVANADGSGSPTQLTTSSQGPAVHDQPSWSTDGSKIAFSGGSNGAGPFDVYVMKTDGTGQTNLTPDSAADDRIASWSPDASKIAFTSTRSDNTDVYVMNANGSGVARVTTDPAADTSPSWSPGRVTGLSGSAPAWKHEGDAIAYAFDGDLYTQAVATSGSAASVSGSPARIYDFDPSSEFGPPPAHHPSWSRDGSSIAFDAAGDIYRLPATGGAAVQLTNNGEDERDPSWSHTVGENRIAYNRGPTGCELCFPATKLYVLDPNNPQGTQTKINDDGAFPSFGTNGRIAFVRHDDREIWSTNPDGTGAKQLTTGGEDTLPSAAGDALAFDRLFPPPGCEVECGPSEADIMLTKLLAGEQSTVTFAASSDVPLKGEVDYVCNGTAYVSSVGLDPDETVGALQIFNERFDGSNGCGGGVLLARVTDGVQYNSASSTTTPPTSNAKPPTAAIFTPLDATYPMGATFPVSGTGYDAEGRVLPASNLHWTLTLPNGTVQDLGNFGSKDIRAPLPVGWPGGTLTFTLVASDGVVSSAPVTRNVRVIFGFVGGGFLPPTLNPPGVNSAKAGSTIPIKWQLTDASGNYIPDLSTVAPPPDGVTYQSASCTFTQPFGSKIALPTGGTFLRYNASANQFVYNWATPMTTGCYVFTLTLTDGTQHQAYFKFT